MLIFFCTREGLHFDLSANQDKAGSLDATEIKRFQADEIFGKWLTTLFKSSWQGEKERLFIILKTKKAVIKKDTE